MSPILFLSPTYPSMSSRRVSLLIPLEDRSLGGRQLIHRLRTEHPDCPLLSVHQPPQERLRRDCARSAPRIQRRARAVHLGHSQSLYAKLVKSATVLSFTFASSKTRNVTISVPFMHLNLTLDVPLVETLTRISRATREQIGTLSVAPFCRMLSSAPNGPPEITAASLLWPRRRAPYPCLRGRGLDPTWGPDIGSGSNDWLASWDNVWSPLSDDEGKTEEAPSMRAAGAAMVKSLLARSQH